MSIMLALRSDLVLSSIDVTSHLCCRKYCHVFYEMLKIIYKHVYIKFYITFQPSYSDIAANPKVLKWMTDLTKLRKQIKGKGCCASGCVQKQITHMTKIEVITHSAQFHTTVQVFNF